MALILKYPKLLRGIGGLPSVYLFGSKNDWQTQLNQKLASEMAVIFDPSLPTDSNTELSTKLNWHFTNLEKASVVVLSVTKDDLFSLTMLEFGFLLAKKSEQMIVHWSEEHPDYPTVQLLCKRYKVQQAKTTDELVEAALVSLKKYEL